MIETTKNEQTARSDKKKDNVKRSKNNKNRNLSNCNRIENKLQWAVNEVSFISSISIEKKYFLIIGN